MRLPASPPCPRPRTSSWMTCRRSRTTILPLIPLYTNYAAGWTMTAWDAYTSGGATGDPNWMNITMPQTKDPFQKGILGADDMGPLRCVLHPVRSSEARLDRGRPHHHRLGRAPSPASITARSVPWFWAAGPSCRCRPPVTTPTTLAICRSPSPSKGTQYASAGADYCYGVNKNTTDDKKAGCHALHQVADRKLQLCL